MLETKMAKNAKGNKVTDVNKSIGLNRLVAT